ncbi:MAG: hypothetical protein J7501_03920 [Bdellovibrio sp.]|nr:hypothetical protein [Bdellovibrio sp.]
MISFTMFILVTFAGHGVSTYSHEFKDQAQCENALKNYKKRFERFSLDIQGFCQEEKK